MQRRKWISFSVFKADVFIFIENKLLIYFLIYLELYPKKSADRGINFLKFDSTDQFFCIDFFIILRCIVEIYCRNTTLLNISFHNRFFLLDSVYHFIEKS